MAIPSPPFDIIIIDWLAISGSFTFHLQQIQQLKPLIDLSMKHTNCSSVGKGS